VQPKTQAAQYVAPKYDINTTPITVPGSIHLANAWACMVSPDGLMPYSSSQGTLPVTQSIQCSQNADSGGGTTIPVCMEYPGTTAKAVRAPTSTRAGGKRGR
jgi:hypothetical protein